MDNLKRMPEEELTEEAIDVLLDALKKLRTTPIRQLRPEDLQSLQVISTELARRAEAEGQKNNDLGTTA